MRHGDLGISGHNLHGESRQRARSDRRGLLAVDSPDRLVFDVPGPRTDSEIRESPGHTSSPILASRLKLLGCLRPDERTNPE